MKTKLFLLPFVVIGALRLTAQQELITNGSFELGEQGWDFSFSPNGYADQGGCDADAGQNYLWFGDFDELTGINNMASDVSQTVSLPSNLDFAEFGFRWSGTSDEQDNVNLYDMFYFGLLDENGDVIYVDSISNADLNPLLTVGLCDDWNGGVVFTIDSQYAGQVIEVFFSASTDGDLPTIFRVDNVSILATTTTTGLSETTISLLEISPNPANEKIVINNDSSADILVSILNSDGRTIQSVNLFSGENELNISSLSNGLYFIQEPNGSTTKIIKQ
jgi:hypothetical protein